jgi:hypothetical protein
MTAARIEIRDAMASHASPAARAGIGSAPRRVLFSFIPGALALAGIAAAGAWYLKPAPAAAVRPVVRFAVPLPPGSDWTRAGRHVIAISPDGSRVAYTADQKLFVRALDQLEAVPIAGVADPAGVFFSPDSQWIGFFAGGNLQKVAITGGAPIPIAASVMPSGASWNDDTIVFAVDTGIMRVSSNGGTPELVIPKKDDERLASPSLVLGGRSVLFTRAHRDATIAMQWDDAEIVVEDLSTHERRTLIRGGADARFLTPHYLVYARRTELLAVAVAPRTLEPVGTPVRLAA